MRRILESWRWMLEATRASDDEADRLQRVVPGFYEFVSDWLAGRLRRIPPGSRRVAR